LLPYAVSNTDFGRCFTRIDHAKNFSHPFMARLYSIDINRQRRTRPRRSMPLNWSGKFINELIRSGKTMAWPH